MEKQINELKKFSEWFEVQANTSANDLLTERHAVKLNTILKEMEAFYEKMAEQKKEAVAHKAYIISGMSLLERIAEGLENKNPSLTKITESLEDINEQIRVFAYSYQNKPSLWERIKKWLSWS